MKRCSKCRDGKELSEFSHDKRSKDGFQSWCKKCSKKSVIKWMKDNPERLTEIRTRADRKHKEKYPERRRARQAVADALRAGQLSKPTNCESCFKECNPEGHHKNYEEDKWLDVGWLCTKCHPETHKEKKCQLLNDNT